MATYEIDIASRQAASRRIAAFARRLIVLVACLLPVPGLAVEVCDTNPVPCKFPTILEALQDPASAGEDVIVHPGTYIERDLSVSGRTLKSLSDNPADTIIDGNGVGTPEGVVNARGDVTIRGFTIRGGNNQGSEGGGIRGGGAGMVPGMGHGQGVGRSHRGHLRSNQRDH